MVSLSFENDRHGQFVVWKQQPWSVFLFRNDRHGQLFCLEVCCLEIRVIISQFAV